MLALNELRCSAPVNSVATTRLLELPPPRGMTSLPNSQLGGTQASSGANAVLLFTAYLPNAREVGIGQGDETQETLA